MKRIGTLMKLKPGALEAYTKLHDNIWDEVVEAANKANMRNYTIFMTKDGHLFSYYEYVGEDFDGDMAKKNALQISQKWQEATGAFREFMDGESKVIELQEIWHHDFE